MNNKTFTIHIFCLLMFVCGCGIFWIIKNNTEDFTVNSQYNNKCFTNLSNNITEEQGRKTSHNTSINGNETKIHQISPVSSTTLPNDITIKKEQLTENRKCKSDNVNKTLHNDSVVTEIETIVSSKNDKKFNGFNQMEESKNPKNDYIEAVIHDDQKNLNENSQVKLRLLENIYLNGNIIPKNTIIYAEASFSSDRIYLTTESITYQKKTYPFNAIIYDFDNSEGISSPTKSKVTISAGYKVKIKKKEN